MKIKNKLSPIKNITKTLPVLIGVVVIICVVMFIRETEVPTVLPVNDIQLEGELYFLDEQQVMALVKDNIVDGYFTADLKYVREVLLQQPWIKDVSLRRKWPANVTVFVEERKPIAFWNSDAYISESGDVFKPDSIDDQLNLPQLNGPENQHSNVMRFMNVLYQQMALLDFEVKRLDLDERRAWQLVINSNVNEKAGGVEKVISVKLGRFDTEKRLQRFIRILPMLTAEIKMTENTIKVIDMRYPNGFAVHMVEPMVSAAKSHRNHDFEHVHCCSSLKMSEA